jgi:putative ABC transport system permease protein
MGGLSPPVPGNPARLSADSVSAKTVVARKKKSLYGRPSPAAPSWFPETRHSGAISQEASYMERTLQDLAYAARSLLRKPGFAAIAVLTLTLGIGASTAIFTVVNALLLQPLSYPQPRRLVTLRSNQSLPDLDDIKQQSRAFEYFGGVTLQALDFTGEAEPLQVQAGLVNSDLFGALGVPTAIGRTIGDEEDRYGGPAVVVLGHDFWQAHFAGDPGVIGKTVPLSGNTYTIIGVMPPGFRMPEYAADVWAPLRVVNPLAAKFRGVHFLRTYFRLSPGASMQQAQAEIESIDNWLAEQYPDENKGRRSLLVPLLDRVVGNVRPALLVLLGSVLLVLLIACANFANLLIGRAASRRQEVVIRSALGASRWRLVRQMVTESLLLSVAGGAGGLVLARLGIYLLLWLKPKDLPRLSDVRIDELVLAFTLGAAVLIGVVLGIIPPMAASRSNAGDALKDAGRGATEGAAGRTTRSLLVVSEVALALVLLIGAGLLTKGFWVLHSVSPGFDPEGVLTMRVELPESRYREIPKQIQFRQALLDGLNSVPAVQAAMVSELPLSGDYLTHNFVIEGRPPLAPGEAPEVNVRSVGGDYFRTMRIPVLAGRDFTIHDTIDTPIVGIVNESFVREYFPNESPVGARIMWARQNPPRWMTIVGVAGDVRHFGLGKPEEPAFYYSYAQLDQPWKRWMYLVVRGKLEAGSLAQPVKQAVWSLDSRLPVTRVEPMTSVISASMAAQQFNMLLMIIFAGAAVILSAVGIFGVISYSVTRRSHEIGIRMALGARRWQVFRLVIGQGMILACSGAAIGLAAALALTRLLSGLLFGVTASDPLVFGTTAAVLLLVGFLSCYIPARRATRVDPMITLRYE